MVNGVVVIRLAEAAGQCSVSNGVWRMCLCICACVCVFFQVDHTVVISLSGPIIVVGASHVHAHAMTAS